MEEQQRKRYHNMMLAQQIQYLKPPLDTLDKLLAKVGKIGAERYAGILHDKDIGEEDHIHLFMHLLRRLSLVLHMTKENIEAVKFCSATKNFHLIAGANRPNPYYQPPEKQQDNKVEKFNALFEDIHSTDSEE